MAEGYWYCKWEHKDFPKPIKNELTEEESKEVFRLMKIKEDECFKNYVLYSQNTDDELEEIEGYSSDIGIESTKGLSPCRLCDDVAGNLEYFYDGTTWTGGLGHHYVLKHRVKPSDSFLKFIGFKS